jgi:hypothetical protein
MDSPIVPTIVDKMVVIILAFHDRHPSVPIEDIKAFAKVIGDITTDFALEVTKQTINETLRKYEDN